MLLLPLVLFLVDCASPDPKPGLIGPCGPLHWARETTVSAEPIEFALDLYLALRSKSGNILIAPDSIQTILNAACVGARGETEKELKRALHLPDDRPAILFMPPRSVSEKVSAGDSEEYILQEALGVWMPKDRPLRAEYLALVRQHFGAEIRRLDFASEPEEAANVINDWVNRQTRGKIKSIVNPLSLDGRTSVLLTSAIFFDGKWKNEFLKEGTILKPFRDDASRVASVPMMTQTDLFYHASVDGVSLLELPYRGDRISMVIVLPNEANGLQKIEEELDASRIASWMARLSLQEVRIHIPRFKFDTTIALSQTVRALGVELALNRQADFSGMAADPGVFVSDLIHRATIDIDEQGMVAAGATESAMWTMKATASKPLHFLADHPFLFLIRENESGRILFLGRFAEPKAECKGDTES